MAMSNNVLTSLSLLLFSLCDEFCLNCNVPVLIFLHYWLCFTNPRVYIMHSTVFWSILWNGLSLMHEKLGAHKHTQNKVLVTLLTIYICQQMQQRSDSLLLELIRPLLAISTVAGQE